MEDIKIQERKRIGARIATIRRSLGITQEQLAESTGFKQANISRIERGQYNVTFDTLTIIAHAFNMKIDFVEDLFFDNM
ncbi:MAG: helix-turn-helix domain-containing protein [Odoribacteraceae bacterium]|jgi:transcriptional regulator with XRE-family HTH domain|nr:helix-turn-helix domain-containing protein [Odoribacteraceae bacterium]